jgi:predicted GIY-YIG superfamily endonuclease
MKLYCCYLLISLHPKYKNYTYIGFTVNPKRRIRQHNGEIGCGAHKTHGKRPWQMIVVLSGFPDKTSALKFEWAWQYPTKSKRTRDIISSLGGGVGQPYSVGAKIRYLYEMVLIPPWRRFPLTINWFTKDFAALLEKCPSIPKHMDEKFIQFDEMESCDEEDGGEEENEMRECEDHERDDNEEKKFGGDDDDDDDLFNKDYPTDKIEEDFTSERTKMNKKGGEVSFDIQIPSQTTNCSLCRTLLTTRKHTRCPKENCHLRAHLTCFAQHLLRQETPYSSRTGHSSSSSSIPPSPKLIPTIGSCPVCFRTIKWVEVVRITRQIDEITRKRKREQHYFGDIKG